MNNFTSLINTVAVTAVVTATIQVVVGPHPVTYMLILTQSLNEGGKDG